MIIIVKSCKKFKNLCSENTHNEIVNLYNESNLIKNVKKYFELSLESLISEKLLIKKAKEFNKNILKLTKKDASKYILARYNNSNEVFEKFLKKNDLSKSVVLSNIQLEIIKKFLIGKMFEKEYDDYLKDRYIFNCQIQRWFKY